MTGRTDLPLQQRSRSDRSGYGRTRAVSARPAGWQAAVFFGAWAAICGLVAAIQFWPIVSVILP